MWFIHLGTAFCMFIAHTQDNNLHFLSDGTVYTIPLQSDSPLLPIRPDSDQLAHLKHIPESSPDSPQIADLSFQHPNSRSSAIRSKPHRRVDDIYLSADGYVVYNQASISLIELLSHPIKYNGILMTASKKHKPEIINNTIIIKATILVEVIDLINLEQNMIKFNYIACLYTEMASYESNGNELIIDGFKYSLSAPLIGLYGRKIENGLNFMVRLFKEGELDIYRDGFRNGLAPAPNHKIKLIITILILSGTLLISLIYLYYPIKIKIGTKVCKELSHGEFMGKKCLAYRIEKEQVEKYEKIRAVNHPILIDCIFIGHVFMRRVVFTEMTFQFIHTAQPDNFRHSDSLAGYLYKLVSAIEAINKAEQTHGRICPENVRITQRGEILLQPFFDNSGWESPGMLAGRVDINQTRVQINKSANNINDDRFALGCVLHFFLTGYHPFDYDPNQRPGREPARRLSKQPGESLGQQPGEPLSQSHGEPLSQQPGEPLSQSHGESDSNSAGACNCVYRKILTEDQITAIRNNVVSKKYTIRISNQVKHDLIYSAVFKNDIKLSSHPYFWSIQKRTELICDFSDFIETETALRAAIKMRVERTARVVFDRSWLEYLDEEILQNIENKRKYDGAKLCDLLRHIRNSHRHFQELPYKGVFGNGGVGEYYMGVFPELFLIVYKNKEIQNEEHFKQYF